MINIFGTTISAPPVLFGQLYENILADVAKKAEEKELLRSFLGSPSLTGVSRLEEIVESAKAEAVNLPNVESLKPQAIQFYISQLKQFSRPNTQTTYENLVLKLIAANKNFASAPIARQLLQGDLVDLPKTFPGDHKRAEDLIHQEFESSITAEQCREYQTYRLAKADIQKTIKDLFFAINHGLDKGQATRFAAVFYELDKIKSAPALGEQQFKQAVVSAITTDNPLELVHIKSLRFTYPSGDSLRVLENTSSTTQPATKGGTRTYPSEEVIFSRLQAVASIFSRFNVATNITVIVSDPDLDYCFPTNQNYVNPEDIIAAKNSLARYLSYLKSTRSQFNPQTLTEFLVSRGQTERFDHLFNDLISEAVKGGGPRISEKILEMRVNEQFLHYSEMFKRYNRQFARYTVIRQIANVLSLSVVFESFATTPILVIDSRGLEDQLISGLNPKAVGKYFTKLKDPVVTTT